MEGTEGVGILVSLGYQIKDTVCTALSSSTLTIYTS